MTTVVTDSSGGTGEGRGTAARKAARIWQIPLLLAGIAAFGFGVRSLVRAIRPVPFAVQVKDVRALLAAGQNVKAINQINAICNYYVQRDQQAELEWLAGDAEYLAQVKLNADGGGDSAVGFGRAAEHYHRAEAFGANPTELMNERWGLAALATGNDALAIEKLEAAAASDPAVLLDHAHELVAAYMQMGNIPKAKGVVERLLKSESKHVSLDDRAWGYGKEIELALMQRGAGGGEGGGAGGADGALQAAVAQAKQAVIGIPERDPSGRILVWIGRAEFETGNLDAAKTDLEAARKRFLVHHLDDGRAAVLLGKIALLQQHPEAAEKLFQEVVMGQTGTPVWAAARFGRASALAAQDEVGDDMEQDYRFVIDRLQGGNAGNVSVPELVTLGEVRAGLMAEYDRDALAGKYQEALEFLKLLKQIKGNETPAEALAWATTRERRALQIEAELHAPPAVTEPATQPSTQSGAGEKTPTNKDATDLLRLAAEDYLRHAKLTTMQDDVSGNSLWKAAQIFDQAGETMRSIAMYQEFTSERPRDPRVPEGLLAMGRLYQSAGMVDKAIPVYQRNIEKNPRTPAAYISAVNLARCYMMKGTDGADGAENFKKAEASLLSLVQDNEDLLPTANEYRTSLFTLGELYYRNGRWADAILRLEEFLQRYPGDAGIPRATFMLAETYRKSANEIAAALRTNPTAQNRDDLKTAEMNRYARAGELFGRVIALLDADPEQVDVGAEKTLPALEEEYLRTSYMDRAECSFAMADYAGAIKYYDVAATRFSQDAMAVEAYLQIVNSYQAMHEPAQATAAAERGRWVLKRIPDDAFGKGALKLTRGYYEELLTLAKGT